MKITSDSAVEFVRQGAPRVIRNDEELKQYTEALFDLTAKGNPSEAEIEAIDLLTLLVTSYEEQFLKLPEVTAEEVRQFLKDHSCPK